MDVVVVLVVVVVVEVVALVGVVIAINCFQSAEKGGVDRVTKIGPKVLFSYGHFDCGAEMLKKKLTDCNLLADVE